MNEGSSAALAPVTVGESLCPFRPHFVEYLFMTRKVYLSGIGYTLGEPHRIADLNEVRTNPELRDALLSESAGLENYLKSEKEPYQLGIEAVRKSLPQLDVQPNEIDGVIYATSSFWKEEYYKRRQISRLLIETDLMNAYPIGTFFSDCANFQSGVRLASSLVRAGEMKNVLLVTVDRAQGLPNRVIPPSVSIASDAGGCCLISNRPQGYEIKAISQRVDARLSTLDPSVNRAAYLDAVFSGIRNIVKDVLNTEQILPKDVCALVTNNYVKSTLLSIGMMCGFTPDQLFLDNVPRLAHSFASDNLINLSDLVSKIRPTSRDYYVLLGTGTQTWGAILVQRTPSS